MPDPENWTRGIRASWTPDEVFDSDATLRGTGVRLVGMPVLGLAVLDRMLAIPDPLGLDVGCLYDLRPPLEVIGDQFAVRRRVHAIGLKQARVRLCWRSLGLFHAAGAIRGAAIGAAQVSLRP